MPLLLGFIFLALGISLLVAWFEAFLIALKGILVLSLLVWGAIFVLVGYSEMKARREFESAAQNDGEAASIEAASIEAASINEIKTQENADNRAA
jgi:hypothetical protein